MKNKTINDPFYLQIQREIDRIEKKEKTYTALFYGIRIIQILMTGCITVVTGLSIDHDAIPANSTDDGMNARVTVLILAAIVTLVTALDTLFQVDAKKNTYKLVLFELKAVRTELVYCRLEGVDQQTYFKKRKELFDQYKKANAYARDLIGSDADKEGQ